MFYFFFLPLSFVFIYLSCTYISFIHSDDDDLILPVLYDRLSGHGHGHAVAVIITSGYRRGFDTGTSE